MSFLAVCHWRVVLTSRDGGIEGLFIGGLPLFYLLVIITIDAARAIRPDMVVLVKCKSCNRHFCIDYASLLRPSGGFEAIRVPKQSQIGCYGQGSKAVAWQR